MQEEGGLADRRHRRLTTIRFERFTFQASTSGGGIDCFKQVKAVTKDKARSAFRHLVAFAGDILAAAAELSWRDRTKTIAWYGAILMALQCGLRKNEITNLRWEDIDLDAGRVRIQHWSDCSGQYWSWLSKGKHEGEMPMGDLLWATVCRLRELRPWRYPFLSECQNTTCRPRYGMHRLRRLASTTSA